MAIPDLPCPSGFCHNISDKLEYLLRPVSQAWSNFKWIIIMVGETLRKVLGQIGSKLDSMATESAHWLIMGKKQCLHLFMPPTSKKLTGVLVSRCLCVHLSILMHAISYEPCMLGFWNFLIWIPHGKIADPYFLAHLSQRLTRWAYRMGLELVSVRACVRPQFQAWISPRPAGRLQPNIIWSIIGVGERLH